MDRPNGKLTPIERQMMIDAFVEEMPFQINLLVESSKVFKARFDSLVASGFTEDQALEIVKARGLQI
ncbi:MULTISPECIES: hypothetical protein [Bacillales]|uniref:hypothetical protein n=1 Tax=Bacillales TaxID=1385 RepID=UPI000346C2B3|nr:MULTISPECIES: hypothetical protein [Bacillales]KMZ43969.1 hypothetical protein AC624_24370 [Bacillus sp. FJAT-27238]